MIVIEHEMEVMKGREQINEGLKWTRFARLVDNKKLNHFLT